MQTSGEPDGFHSRQSETSRRVREEKETPMNEPLFRFGGYKSFGDQLFAMHEECQRRWAVHLQMIADLKAIAWLVFWFSLAWWAN